MLRARRFAAGPTFAASSTLKCRTEHPESRYAVRREEVLVTTVDIRTHQRCELVDVTAEVAAVVRDSGVRRGAVIIYVPHTTAGCTINENADPAVKHDLLLTLADLVPKDRPGYRHGEGNSDAHTKASLLGFSQTVLIENGKLLLGTWQGVYFAEFDGPRSRRMCVRVVRHD
jgi:secondary thiamine-phosphate synthase enzyme